MQDWFFDSPDPEQTVEYAAALGRSIGAGGLALALIGPLGAGKTVFVKGLALGLGLDPRAVSSPTFVIAQQYPLPTGPEAMHHVDLYRLESANELEAIGFDDMLAEGQVLAVEWADRFPEVLGSDYLQIEFEGPSPAEQDAATEGVAWRGRRARVTAHGVDAGRILEDWAQRIDREWTSPAETDGSRGGARLRFVREARVLMMLLLGVAAVGANHLELNPRGPDCPQLVELDRDRLGTLRAQCEEPGSIESRPLSGVARLLEGQKIDLNRASLALLRVLPQIGPTRAEAIVLARQARTQGRFSRLEELESVSGIGPKTRMRIEPWLSIAGSDRGSSGIETGRDRDG